MARKTNRVLIPEAIPVLEKFKYEIANELGIQNYDKIDKGALPARVNGAVGGNMVKRMIALAQQVMTQTGGNVGNTL